jgi:hypothetical protein
VLFVDSLKPSGQFFFGDGYSLGRFSYADPNRTNVFPYNEGIVNYTALTNTSELETVPWTILVQVEKENFFLYVYYGIVGGEPNLANLQGVDRFYDNEYLQMYVRTSNMTTIPR